MSNLSSKILKILTWVLMGITVVFAIIFYFGSVKPDTVGTRLEEPVVTQSFLVWAYFLFFATAGITIIFSIINFIINPKGTKIILIAFLAGAAVIVVAYLFADDTVLNMPFYDGKDNVPQTLKFVDTVMFTAYILAGLALLSILYSTISRVFK
ncbi:MAG TPA: hypothetical protein VMW76_00900 [Bacteroidales bacterium]|nr:hypothetical protein [Bacteroidales bacterium]